MGLLHIWNHADDFEAIGIAKDNISELVMQALSDGTIVGYQGKGMGRLIYEVMYNGEKKRIAITVGNNGFIVGANTVNKFWRKSIMKNMVIFI